MKWTTAGQEGMKPSGAAIKPTDLSWQGIVRNGSLLGLVLWLHLTMFLALMSLRARVPDSDVPWRKSDDVMQARLVERIRPVPRRPSQHVIAALPEPSVRRAPPPAVSGHAMGDSTAVDPAPAHAEEHVPIATAPSPGAAEDYGDPTLRDALHGQGSSRPQLLPGADDGPLAGKFRAIPPRSMKERVRSMGAFMNCSIVEMARNRPGQLNVVRIADAYTDLGCKK